MRCNWLLEKDAFEDSIIEEMKQAIDSQGMEYKILVYEPFEGVKFLDKYKAHECVLVYGSLGLTQQVLSKSKWVPGAWCDLHHFKCSYYYPRLYQHLLNNRYMMVPYGELIRQKDFLFQAFDSDQLFMRPDSGFKTFTGKVVCSDDEDYRKDIDFFGFYDIEPQELVVVSDTKSIHEEWRLVVANKEIVASSLYKDRGVNKSEEGCPPAVWQLAEEIANVWQPDICYVIDICRLTNAQLRLVEINSFSSSGLYACNKKAVVEAVSAAAVKEWKGYLDD